MAGLLWYRSYMDSLANTSGYYPDIHAGHADRVTELTLDAPYLSRAVPAGYNQLELAQIIGGTMVVEGSLQSVEATAHVTRGKNLFDGSQVSTTHTSNWGVTWSDNTLTIEHKTSYTTGVPTFPLNVPSGDYVLSYASTTETGKISFYRNNSWVKTLNNGTTFTVDEADTNEIRFSADVGTPVTTVNIQIESGTTATEYSPYHAPTSTPLANITLRGISETVDGVLSYDGDTYDPDGTVTRYYGMRAYQAGDESLTDAITDGTDTVYKLVAPTTESADPYTAMQTVEEGGMLQFVTNNNVPVGNVSIYRRV